MWPENIEEVSDTMDCFDGFAIPVCVTFINTKDLLATITSQLQRDYKTNSHQTGRNLCHVMKINNEEQSQ